MNKYTVNDLGFYGNYGGAYIPEILYKTVEDLKNAYLPIIESEEFKKEYHALLRDYVGRPSPLYYAKLRQAQDSMAWQLLLHVPLWICLARFIWVLLMWSDSM